MVDTSVQEDCSQVIRRRDLRDLGDAFKKSLRPMSSVLEHMKQLNINWELSRRQMRSVVRLQVALLLSSLFILLLLGLSMQSALTRLSESYSKLQELEAVVKATTEDLQALKATTAKTEGTVEEVKKAQEERPRVELVPETDPVKAVAAPLKLRVTPPVVAERVEVPVPSIFSSSATAAAPAMAAAPVPSVAEIPIPRGAP